MDGSPKFTIAFNIRTTNEDRLEMCDLYQKAFHAKKLSQETPPDGNDIHIMMEFAVLILPRVTGNFPCDDNIITERTIR